MVNYKDYTVEELAADVGFIRWVKGEDPQAQQFWNSFQQQYPAKVADVKRARQLVELFLAINTNRSIEATTEEFKESKLHILQKIQQKSAPNLSPNTHTINFRFYLRAAVITLLITSGLAFFWAKYQSAPIIYQTAVGEIHTVTLPDLTLVTLNTNSTLQVYKNWQKNNPREVWLTGEAFFKVTTQPDAEDNRFIVHTDVVDVQVLGTEFNLRQRRYHAEVVLTEGKVAVSGSSDLNNDEFHTMQPGDRLHALGSRMTKNQVDVKKYISWRHNRLYFEEQTLLEIAEKLEDDYGLMIKFQSREIADMTFTGSCPANDLSILYEALSAALNLTILQEDQLLLIKNNQNQ